MIFVINHMSLIYYNEHAPPCHTHISRIIYHFHYNQIDETRFSVNASFTFSRKSKPRCKTTDWEKSCVGTRVPAPSMLLPLQTYF